jgi:hypothetical protein
LQSKARKAKAKIAEASRKVGSCPKPFDRKKNKKKNIADPLSKLSCPKSFLESDRAKESRVGLFV